jgi:iron complex outermembrane receptor protein
VRLTHYRIFGTPNFFFRPASRDLFLADGFVQDSFSLTPRLTLTAGLKVEKDPYAGASVLPDLLVAWKPRSTVLVWGSVSRAVRSPTPFDEDVRELSGPVSLNGNPQFKTEKLTAYELGVRLQPTPRLSVSANGYYNVYDDLRSIELTATGPALLNFIWGNGLKGHTYGLDAWADWQPFGWWKISAGVSLIEQRLHFAKGATGILGTGQLGADPSHVFKLRSSMDLGSHLTLDADFRAVGALPGTTVRAYQELGGRLAWTPLPKITLSVSGFNLLHRSHQEYPGGDLIPRRVLAGVEFRY